MSDRISNQDVAILLKATYPFLSTADIDKMIAISAYRIFKNKEVIIRQGTVSKKVYFTLSGMIRGYFFNQKGEEINIFLRPEHTITGSPDGLFRDKASKYTFESVLSSHLLVFTFEEFREAGLEFPNLNQVYVESLQEIIQTLIFRVESLINKHPADRYDELLERRPQFFQKAFNKHIANYLGITPNSLSRIIKRKKNPNS